VEKRKEWDLKEIKRKEKMEEKGDFTLCPGGGQKNGFLSRRGWPGGVGNMQQAKSTPSGKKLWREEGKKRRGKKVIFCSRDTKGRWRTVTPKAEGLGKKGK